ncbi:MAG: 16S rRNA (guanine(1207)-N(2))-methyltransferase RsmC [Buchnera aphidicola (Brevicoryne brassicae)]|uniref:Ribosomal RNA small subunit methyltransferase C n=1 Tax=Buchnera aphidicola (Brevicoryne brassicae) TaxID=911343 RepID=A0AAJ5PTU2_9GAMM|nr:MAG: 16S rRNA (guanine(1207)-N(2))-methyltransferase RsmC [Buchnera aphidicola (Brevicoryne brassicae)]
MITISIFSVLNTFKKRRNNLILIFSKNSQLILRNRKIFRTKRVFFSGNIKDNLPMHLSTNQTKINFQKYNDYINFQKKNNTKNINVYNELLVSEQMTQNCDTIIYYWPKSKSEAKFQLINIMSCFPIGTKIFIVGDNSSGVKSAPLILKKWLDLKKIDNAKHCILIFGFLKKKIKFTIKDFFKTHIWKDFSIKSLPGVFGYKKIDEGSKLLASTFSENINGKILDIGSGTGFLSVCLLYSSPKANLTLTDNSVTALECSKETLYTNKLKGDVIISDLYSNIFNKFDLIISNPPFHEDLSVNFDITKKIISYSIRYLRKKGELRFVTNICFNYDFLLNKIFKTYSVMKKNNKFKVYQAFLK